MAKPRILLVEGNDDKHAVLALANYYELPEAFEIADKGGIDPLLESLPTQLKASGLEVLGILVDADIDLLARWQSLRSILSQVGYIVPEQPIADGTILRRDDLPIVGIWLMPDNCLPGILEDFAAALIPGEDSLWPRAQGCVEKIPTEERRFPVERAAKAKIHTWLAWQEEPGKPIGLAMTMRYLNPNAQQAQRFVNWLHDLFVVS